MKRNITPLLSLLLAGGYFSPPVYAEWDPAASYCKDLTPDPEAKFKEFRKTFKEKLTAAGYDLSKPIKMPAQLGGGDPEFNKIAAICKGPLWEAMIAEKVHPADDQGKNIPESYNEFNELKTLDSQIDRIGEYVADYKKIQELIPEVARRVAVFQEKAKAFKDMKLSSKIKEAAPQLDLLISATGEKLPVDKIAAATDKNVVGGHLFRHDSDRGKDEIDEALRSFEEAARIRGQFIPKYKQSKEDWAKAAWQKKYEKVAAGLEEMDPKLSQQLKTELLKAVATLNEINEFIETAANTVRMSKDGEQFKDWNGRKIFAEKILPIRLKAAQEKEAKDNDPAIVKKNFEDNLRSEVWRRNFDTSTKDGKSRLSRFKDSEAYTQAHPEMAKQMADYHIDKQGKLEFKFDGNGRQVLYTNKKGEKVKVDIPLDIESQNPAEKKMSYDILTDKIANLILADSKPRAHLQGANAALREVLNGADKDVRGDLLAGGANTLWSIAYGDKTRDELKQAIRDRQAELAAENSKQRTQINQTYTQEEQKAWKKYEEWAQDKNNRYKHDYAKEKTRLFEEYKKQEGVLFAAREKTLQEATKDPEKYKAELLKRRAHGIAAVDPIYDRAVQDSVKNIWRGGTGKDFSTTHNMTLGFFGGTTVEATPEIFDQYFKEQFGMGIEGAQLTDSHFYKKIQADLNGTDMSDLPAATRKKILEDFKEWHTKIVESNGSAETDGQNDPDKKRIKR